MKVLLAFKNLHATDPSVCHQGLGITATNASMALTAAGIETALWPVVDGYDLRKRLRWHQETDKYTHCVLFAPFFDIGFMEQLVVEWPGIQWAITCHSNVGFLQSDRWSLKVMRQGAELAKRYTNFRISGNSYKFVRFMREGYGADCLWLPNLYALDEYDTPPVRPCYPSHGPLKVGIFGATRALKNISSAAGAAVVIAEQLGARLQLFISKGREEGPGADRVHEVVDEITRGLGHITVIRSPWQLWPDFKRTVAKMHLTLQPSFTETFNNVSADAASQGVPVVCSPQITWAPKHWQADPDDVCDIARVGMALLRDPRARLDGREAIGRHNREALAVWSEWLN